LAILRIFHAVLPTENGVFLLKHSGKPIFRNNRRQNRDWQPTWSLYNFAPGTGAFFMGKPISVTD
jgi:hypothetical protein